MRASSPPAEPPGTFPPHFLWGAATSAYQIEGASREDGREPCVWDMMAQKPGGVFRNQTAEVACDHYHRYMEDIALMREIGLQAYRFSISWPRILPQGRGPLNEKGLSFYDRLVDSLLEANIEPCVTLFHWDFPLALYHRGGWLNADSPQWLADYAEAVGNKIGDRVKLWITLNEPQCFIGAGLLRGEHAPGDKLEMSAVLLAVHHSLLAHGRSVQALRAACPGDVKIGFAPTGGTGIPAMETSDDIEAAREFSFAVDGSLFNLSLWADPIYLGSYPSQARKIFDGRLPEPSLEEWKLISQPLDFIGFNCYTGTKISRAQNGGWLAQEKPAGNPVGSLGWLEVEDDVLYWAARFQSERYGGLPFFVTENGIAVTDWVARDGRVHDPQRIDYAARCLTGLRRAGSEGIPLGGYFYWSFMDNFEWAEGYRPRFGLVHVDYSTQRRTIKDSGFWYRDVIASHGRSLSASPSGTAQETRHQTIIA